MNNRIISFLLCLLVSVSLFADKPKYIFYFIGDGMGLGPILAAETYNRQVLKNDDKLLMMQFPVASTALTYSHENPITDSAAAGTALATGHKTRNGMIGMTADSTAVNSIAKLLKSNGYGVAITTSVYIDDATPCAFYANASSRKQYYEICQDLLNSDFDFFAGAALRGKKDNQGKDVKLFKNLEKKGYGIAQGMSEYAAAKTKDKILLINPKEKENDLHIGYTIDSIPGALTLPEITKAAIEHMERVSPEKFFIMVEGGNIDWAAHGNDGGGVIKEILNFNESLQLAYDFYLQHPNETLIIVTADHDTGGMSIGTNKGPKVANLSYIDFQRISKEAFSAKCSQILKSGEKISWEKMKGYLKEYFGLYDQIKLNKKQDEDLKEEFEEVFEKHSGRENKTLYNSFNGFVEQVYKLLDRTNGFGWTTNSHTGCLVPVFAIGEGANDFSKLNNNTEIPQKIAKLAGFNLD